MNLQHAVIVSFWFHAAFGYGAHLTREFFKFRQIGFLNNVFCYESDALFFSKNSTSPLITSNKYGARGGMMYEADFTALNKNRLGVSIDMDCPSSKTLIRKLSNDFKFNNTFVYLLHTRRFDDTVQLLGDINLAFDSDVTLRSGHDFYDVYKIHYRLPLRLTNLGNWSNKRQLNLNTRPDRKDLYGAPIKGAMALLNLTVTREELHEKMLDYLYEPEKDLLTRTGYSLMNIIREMFNFTLDLIIITDDFGYLNETTGRFGRGSIFEAIQDNLVDFSVSLSTYQPTRMIVGNYAPQGSRFRTCFIFKHPHLLAEHTSFAKPFSNKLWCVIFAFIITFGLGFRVIRQVNVKDKPPHEASLLGSLVLTVGIMAQQGLPTHSRRLPIRILAIFGIVASLVIYVNYGAAIVRFLLSSTPRTLNNVEKLLRSSLELYAEDIKYQRYLFLSNLSTEATKTYYRAIKRAKGDDRFISLDEGMKRVRRGNFALYASDTNMYAIIEKTFTETDKCELAEVTTYLSGVGHTARKLSPFREILFIGTARSKECGLQERERSHWYRPKPSCQGLTSVAVSYQATFIAQMIFVSGLVLSIVVLCFEIKLSRLITAVDNNRHHGDGKILLIDVKELEKMAARGSMRTTRQVFVQSRRM